MLLKRESSLPMGPHVRPASEERMGWTCDSGLPTRRAFITNMTRSPSGVWTMRLPPLQSQPGSAATGCGADHVRPPSIRARRHHRAIVDHVVVAHGVPAGEPIPDQ